MSECFVLEPGEGSERDVKRLAEEFLPILDRFWAGRGRAWYGQDSWGVQAAALAYSWLSGNIVIFLAKEAGETVGFLMGARVQPLLTEAAVFEVEAYYGATPQTEQEILDYFKKASRFFTERWISLPDYGGGAADKALGSAPASRRTRSVYRK